jgi:transcriptional regulator with XRE-family HTH domain
MVINPVNVYVGGQLKALRKIAVATDAEVADVLGILPETLAKIELGEVRLGPVAVQRLCEVYGVKPDWFFSGLKPARTRDVPGQFSTESDHDNLIKIFNLLDIDSRQAVCDFAKMMLVRDRAGAAE